MIKREHCTACQRAEEEKRKGQELKPAGAHIAMFIRLLAVREVPAHTNLSSLLVITGGFAGFKSFL